MRAIPEPRPRFSSSAIYPLLTVVLFVILAPMIGASLQAQETAQPPRVTPRPLITQAVDESRLTTLKGNTHPLARPEFDLGTAPASLPMQRMLLVLKRAPEQETALRTLLDNQQSKASPSYHKWLTPEHYGQQFGPTDSDLQTITGWLQSHGFEVGSTKGRTVLEFSGTAGQVQEAFHTTMHKYIVNGEQHWANASDPQIPTALTGAVAGVLTLHNFLKKPQVHVSKEPVSATLIPGKKRPELTFSDGTNGLGPDDFATIYNSPAFNGTVSGAGVTIGIVGRSNLFNGGQDVDNFAFNAFQCCGRFNIILNGPDPGDLGGGEEAEATLDTTWAGGAAPGAVADLVVSASTNTTDGTDLSEVYIIENNLADIMSESFGGCEAGTTSTQAAGVSLLAEQAAAQGITYFVSTGDNGAEGCDDQNSETVATGPLSVNVLASTPFNVAVGGTVFNENGLTTFWSSTNNGYNGSAISYIPENVWNDSCPASTCSTSANIWAGSGGASTLVAKPSWQSGATGILPDNTRDLPDVSLTAASHDPYLLCLEGSCVPNSQGQFYIYFVWGTSAAAPSFAGIMAMVDQQMWNTTGTLRQGAANYVLYRLATAENNTLSQCNGSIASTLPASTCVFNDVTIGNNAVPGELNYGLSTAEYQSGVGYDMATGLGSVNATNLVNQWNTVTFNPTTTALTLNNGQPVAITHGQSVPLLATVAPNTGTGVPTGDVVLFTGNTLAPSTMELFGLTGGQVISSTSQLAGSAASYNVWAQYGGDATYAPSASVPVSVTVSPEASSTALSVLTFDAFGNQLNFTGGPFGSFVYLRADVAGASGQGIPTGSVTFLDAGLPIVAGSSLMLNSQGNTATPNGVQNFDTGTHTITASYTGDASFNASTTAQAQTFTITAGFYGTIAPAQSTVLVSAPGGSGLTTITIANSTSFSGTISLACSGLPSEAACVFSPATITANGTAGTTSASITVTTKAPTASAQHRANLSAAWMMGLGALLFSTVLIGGKQQRTRGLFLPLLLVLIVVAPGCGGGSSGGGNHNPPPDPGTPTGVSTVLVTATSGSITSTTGFTLVVQ